MRFEKWQALGNDYLILEQAQLPFDPTPERLRALCAPHFGVGADGVLLIAGPADPRDVADVRIFNPDGSEAELSGNGVRQAVLYLRRRGFTDRDTFSIGTAAGRILPTITGPFSARVDMGAARLRSSDYPRGSADGAGVLHVPDGRGAGGGSSWRFRHVSIGNPQCAISVDGEDALAALDLARIGPPVEAHPEFPNRTNVSWYAELEHGPAARIRARIFERGVGETLSSGTGASGAAVAYLLDRQGHEAAAAGSVTVVLDGGELEVEIEPELRVHLSGWAVPVFEGRLSEQLLDQLRRLEPAHATGPTEGGAR